MGVALNGIEAELSHSFNSYCQGIRSTATGLDDKQ
jgi:hypothetical protein